MTLLYHRIFLTERIQHSVILIVHISLSHSHSVTYGNEIQECLIITLS